MSYPSASSPNPKTEDSLPSTVPVVTPTDTDTVITLDGTSLPAYNTLLNLESPTDPAQEITLSFPPAPAAQDGQLWLDTTPGGDYAPRSTNILLGTTYLALVDHPIGYVGQPFRYDTGGNIYVGVFGLSADAQVTPFPG